MGYDYVTRATPLIGSDLLHKDLCRAGTRENVKNKTKKLQKYI